jgi:ABC-2 type transport system ATP-binding protein
MAFLDATDLTQSFGSRQVLGGLTFAIERGEVYGLVGPNGAGKTTTINIVCNLLVPDHGHVRLGGDPVSSRTRSKMGIGTQDIALYRDLTCTQNLEFFGKLYGLRGSHLGQRVAECLTAVALDDRDATVASHLSGGMQRRLHVAVALLHQPQLLILDEPTVGLDLESRRQTWELIGSLARHGSAVLLTTHHLEEAEVLCNRIGILHDGRLGAEGTMTQLRQLVAAAELADVVADDLEGVRRCARALGWTHRQSSGSITLWLPERLSLEEVAGRLAGVALRSLSLRPVRLEDVFREVTRQTPHPLSGTAAPE